MRLPVDTCVGFCHTEPCILISTLTAFSPFIISWLIQGQRVGIRWYGLSYVFSFFLAYVYFRGAMRSNRLPSLTMSVVDTITYSTAFGIVFGGRLAFVIQHLDWLRTDPLFPFKLTEGGMTFFGGLIGVLLALYWVGRKYGMGFLALTDIATFPAALGLALGRIANFINGELVGKPTNGKWGVIFPHVDDLPRYPSQLFESALHFLLYGVLILTHRFAGAWTARPGRLSYLFLTLYGFERFCTDFFRQDDTYLGLFSTGQWASLVVGLAGVIGLILLRAPQAAGRQLDSLKSH